MKSLIKFYFRHKLLSRVFVTGLALGILLLIPEIAAAQGAAEDVELSEIVKGINEVINYILQLASSLLWPVLIMIGSLLDNELIFGGEMGERLRSVWVEIRNLVEIAFVLVLLAIAVYNVLGIGEEGGSFALKQAMPKFVLALVAVHFSFLAVKVVLDFTNVMTAAVFALPARTMEETISQEKLKEAICGTESSAVPMRPLWCKGKEFNDKAKSLFSKLDRNNITLVYAIKFGHAPALKFIRDGLKSLTQLGFNIIFNTVLYVVYALSFIALFLVLLFRVVAIWIAVVLSPLLALGIVVPQLKELAGEGGNLQQKFVKQAIAPVTIGLVLSVGFIMLSAFEADKGIHGEILSSSSLEAIDPNALPTDITDLQQLLIAIGIVVIIWTGVFAAAKDTFAGTITEIIKDKAQGFGKFAATLPAYFQAIPVKMGGDKGKSLAELGGFMEAIPGIVKRDYGASAGASLAEKTFGKDRQYAEALDSIRSANRDGPKEFAKAIANHTFALKSPNVWNEFQTGMDKHFGVKEQDIGTGPMDPKFKAAFDSSAFERFRTESEIKSYSELEGSLEKRPPSSSTGQLKADGDKIADALNNGSGSSLKDQAVFAGMGSDAQAITTAIDKLIEDLKGLPKGLQNSVLEIKDGKVNKDKTNSNIINVTNIRKALGNAGTKADGSVAAAIKELPDATLKLILNEVSSPKNTVVAQAINAKINPAAPTAASGRP